MTGSNSSSDRPPVPQTTRLLEAIRSVFAAPGRVMAFTVLALLVLVRGLAPDALEGVTLRGFDLEQQIAPRRYEPSPIHIVAVDEKSLAKYGQWPWPRTLVARLVRQIAAGHPRVLAVDIIFSEPDRFSPARLAEAMPDLPAPLAGALAALPANEAALADAFRMVPTVLGIGVNDDRAVSAEHQPFRITLVRESGADPRPFLAAYPELLRSVPQLTAVEGGRGALVGNPDADGIVRRVPLFIVSEHRLVPTLALEMLRMASGAGSVGIVTADDGIQGALLGDVLIPTDRHGRAYPHFTKSLEDRYVSAADLLDESYDPAGLGGGLVLLGVTGQGVVDLQQTPLGLMRGVEVQAQLAETILTKDLLRRPSILDGIEIALVLAGGLVTIFALPYRQPRIACAAFGGIMVLIAGAAFVSFRLFNLVLDGVYPSVASALTFGVMLAANLRAAESARRSLAAELEREREIQARLEGELNAARAIQMGLLPQLFPGAPAHHDIDVFALIEPARMVGGDLYDFLLLDGRRLSFAIADVSGKGVPAALFMVMTKEVLRDATARHGAALDRVLAEANAKISAASSHMLGEGAIMMFVTVFAGVLDLPSGRLAYASAGHESPFVLRRGTEPLQLTGEGGPPLGTVDDFPYPLEQRQLTPGDILLLYTDGVTEAEDVNHALYSSARLKQLLASAPTTSARAVVDMVREDVRRFATGAEQADDITLLAVRWLGV